MKPALIVLIGAVGAAALIASTFAGSPEPSAAGRGQELVDASGVPDGRSTDGQAADGQAADGRPTTGDPSGSQPAAPTGPPPTLSGVVEEVLQVPGYTYLAIASEGATRWAAVKTTELAVGNAVSVRVDAVLQDFRSETLDRTFDSIVFGNLPSADAAAANTSSPALAGTPSASADAPSPASAPAAPRHVPPAEGGHRIGELYGARGRLAGTTVRVRGVVTKSLPGIMNRTFVRLEDGSGARDTKTHELTVTTTETPEVGASVLVEGTLVVDRDFGSGYTYDVLLEDARLLKE